MWEIPLHHELRLVDPLGAVFIYLYIGMLIAVPIAGVVSVAAAWFYLLLAHGHFWMVSSMGAPPLSAGPADRVGQGHRIAAVIPARNEADVIGQSIASLLRQAPTLSPTAGEKDGAPGFDSMHIFVVDDNSTDGTADAARAAGAPPLSAASADRVGPTPSSTLTVIPGRPLPSGWSGKLWALAQGVEQALPLNPDFLLFTDADVEHAPDNLATLVSIAEAGNYDLASFMVKLHCRTLPEKLLIPAFVFFFFLLYPPRWIRDPRRRTAGAAGGCILIRPAALERIGGIAAIRREIIDDCALARTVKQTGGKVWLGLTAATHSLRPYGSFGEVEQMIARTAFNQLRHSAWLLLGCVLGMLLVFVLPLALLASGSARLAALGAIAYLLMMIAYMPMVRFYRLAPLWAMALPFSAAFYTAATLHSAMKYWSCRGGEWKGRAQDV